MTDEPFRLSRFWQSSQFKAEAAALLLVVVFFALFFWPATLKGLLLIFSDSLVYSYPLRVVAFDAIRHGSLPLWTPTVLSGYPLLSMAQLGIAYPLTWFYLLLPGYWAEQVYVLAPYLLAPAFTYAYLRQIECSRAASLLAGLSFTYGGMMAGGLAHNGMFTNAVMWLPLMLIAIERARTGRVELCLLGVAAAYSMSVLTGIGQAFLYTGLIALAYAAFASLALANAKRWNPLLVCVGGMLLATGVAAFQILETLRAQRRSIRSELTYEIFSGGGFTPMQSLKAFIAPYHNLNWEATPYVASFAALLAAVAVIAALRAPSANRQILFWPVLALLAWLLMMGDHTPLYRLAFHIPVVNRFRLPYRHAFEWSFAISVLAAFGFDQSRSFFATKFKVGDHRGLARQELIAGLILFANLIAVGVGWWQASGLRLAAGAAVMVNGASTQFATMTESSWMKWKLGFTLAALLSACWCWRLQTGKWRNALLAGTICAACFLESFMLVSVWWFPFAKPASYFQSVSASAQFLKRYSPEENRIYTSLADYSLLNTSFAELHNLSALYGFHNAAGYEPLMPEKYSRAFDGRWSFFTPWFGAVTDPRLLSPRWQVLDLLNTRFLAEYSATAITTIEKDGTIFPARDLAIPLPPNAYATFIGSTFPTNSLSVVSSLSNSGDLAQDETVAKITIRTSDGRIIKRDLKAGRDTAEWAHERADVKPLIKHQLAKVFDHVPGDEQNSFPANRYWSRIDLGEKVLVERVEISNLTQLASIAFSKLALYDSSNRQAIMLTQSLPDHWQQVYNYNDVQIYENHRARPRVWLTTQAEAVSSEEALRRIRGQSEQSFDPKITALLEAPPDQLRSLIGGELGEKSKAEITRYSPNHLVIETNADQPTALVVSEINYPGWEATVDGKRSEIYAADYLLRGIILPAGNHRVEMRYTAPAARNGVILSGLSFLLIVVLLAKSRKANTGVAV